MAAYYNEIDPKAAAWLRELIADGLIPAGEVDTRSIEDVTPDDLRGFTQHHFFAGIGIWPLAFRLAGWPDDRPVASASCPCPPFSSAGKKKACPSCGGTNPLPCPSRTGVFICCLCDHAWFADGRHLYPELWRLIRDYRFDVVFGEQVASEDGRTWLDIVRASLEITAYRLGYSDTCAAGFGAPHIRQRLYWLADTVLAGRAEGRPFAGAGSPAGGGGYDRLASPDGGQRRGFADGQGRLGDGPAAGRVEGDRVASPGGGLVGLEHADRSGAGAGARDHRQAGAEALRDGGADDRAALLLRAGAVGRLGDDDDDEGLSLRERQALVGAGRREEGRAALQPGGPFGRLADADGGHASAERQQRGGEQRQQQADGGPGDGRGPGPVNGLWRAADWLLCRDAKWRPVEPGTFPLADAGTYRNRVAELRGAGNAVNLAQAQGFIEAYLEAERDRHFRLTAMSAMTNDKMDIFA